MTQVLATIEEPREVWEELVRIMLTAPGVGPSTVIDNSLTMASRELPFPVLRLRPGTYAIHDAEEALYHIRLHMLDEELGDSEEVRGYLRTILDEPGGIPAIRPNAPAHRAQLLIYEAIGAPKKKRIESCHKALSIYPGTADAWVILAEYETDPKAKKKLLLKAREAGELLLADEGISFEPGARPKPTDGADDGDASWAGVSRPYLRARLALASHQYAMGEKGEAMKSYRDLLRGNPSDGQGIRYLLVSALLEEASEPSSLDEAEDLLMRLKDDSPMWTWTKIFVDYMRGRAATGKVPPTFIRAYAENPHVPKILLGGVKAGRKPPESSAYGTEDEAFIYGAMASGYWKKSDGALPWLYQTLENMTAGLPDPNAASAKTVRSAISGLCWSEEGGERRRPDLESYAQAIADHYEFRGLFRIPDLIPQDFHVRGVDPYAHVGLHAAVLQTLNQPGHIPSAMRSAITALTGTGLMGHEAIHLLGEVYAYGWGNMLDRMVPLPETGLISNLAYVERLALGQIAAETVLVAPGRNDLCPCGSGRKWKKCCGAMDNWPLYSILSLAEALRSGKGRVTSRRGLQSLSLVLGHEAYGRIDVLQAMPPGHPLVLLDNMAAVGHSLWDSEATHPALQVFDDSVELAKIAGDDPVYMMALTDALRVLSTSNGNSERVSRYAGELARMTVQPDVASLLWAICTEGLMEQGKMTLAQHAMDQAQGTGEIHIIARFTHARFLERTGRREEAVTAYRDAIEIAKVETAGTHHESIVEDATNDLRRLEQAIAREKRKASRSR